MLDLLIRLRIPALGRNPIYVGTLIIFVILTIPAALVHSFPGLLILRFLSGFFGKNSPEPYSESAEIARFALFGYGSCDISGYVPHDKSPLLFSILGWLR